MGQEFKTASLEKLMTMSARGFYSVDVSKPLSLTNLILAQRPFVPNMAWLLGMEVIDGSKLSFSSLKLI